ncbi:MAG: serine hydrolase domain-containing protein [Planctomycetaceae bacterium]
MSDRLIALLVAVPLCLQTASAQQTESPQPAKPRTHAAAGKAANLDVKTLQALDVALQKQVDDKHVSGVIGLIGRQGKIGYFEAFGQRLIEDNAPMTKDCLFRIYSMTKPLVAVTAMSLWEEGKFKLDDPISAHLPEWTSVTAKENDKAVPVNTPVTPRHLMTHSAGLSYSRRGLKLTSDTTLSEFSQALAKQPLQFQPGTDYVYGYSIDILGRYIEAIEGKSLDVVMRERVLDRLGMQDTEFWLRKPADRDRLARVYRKSESEPGQLRRAMSSRSLLDKPSRMMGGQGLISSTGDYARFCQMLLNKGELDGQRVLKTETVDLMFQNHLRKIGKVYGLGGSVDRKGGYSWGGAAGTKFWIDTRNDCYGVFMIQRWGYKAPTYRVFRRLVDRALVAETKN